jgi:DNA gyrase subunit A
MADTLPPEPPDGDGTDTTYGSIEPIEIQEEMERSFLDYAMSVIVSRALPDARDGLKPVHRRILYDMHVQGYRPDRPYVKCAKVTGDTMSRFHPHGNQTIYDALARMAQPFSLREPLIDFHGNYGSPDFPPAAERYCVIGGIRVRLADGSTRRIEDLAGQPLAPNSECDLDLKVAGRSGEPVLATKLFHSGTHPTFRLRTREGYELTGTSNHPVLCLEAPLGVPMLLWRMLGEIEPGTKVAIARSPVDPVAEPTDSERQIGVLLGGWVSEGFANHKRAGFNNTDESYFTAVLDAFDALVGGPRYVYTRTLPSGKSLWELDVQRLDHVRASVLAELCGLRSAEKCVPEVVLSGTPGLRRAFLQALYEGDGSIGLDVRHSLRIHYSTRSERLARELHELLLEFGIASVIGHRPRGEIKVMINGRRNCRLFANRIGFFGAKQRLLVDRLAVIPETSRALSRDHIPFLADYVRAEAPRGGREWLSKHNIDRVDRWERDGDLIMDKIGSPELRNVVRPLVDAGYFYATVESVDRADPQPVFSIRVDSQDHAFLAGGFVNHNTECRLSQLSMRMLEGIDEQTVDMGRNYTNEEDEPTVLPARFPNLLVNGSQGIAVGMATNIPPHNLGEVIDAVFHLIDHPEATPDELMQFVKGPDFPTGAYILGRAGIMDAYRTGRGSIKMRAKAEVDEGRSGTQIVVSALPYQASPKSILEKIAELVNSRELEGIRSLDDLSAGDTTRLVIGLKRDANPNVVLNNLYKHTALQTSFGVNMVALVDGVPRTLNLAQALHAYIDHQVDVIRRRSEFRLKKARDRAHIVEGLLKALDMIDAIIALIRASDDRAAARVGLMAAPFEFTEVQANHILDMTLSRLTRLGRSELEEELAKLRETIAELEAILADEGMLREVIKTELGQIRQDFATPRRAEITFEEGDMSVEDLISDEELVVTMSRAGYIKAVPTATFRTQGRGGRGVRSANLREEDLVSHLIHTTAHSYLLCFSNLGRVYRLRTYEVPVKERTARGTAIVNLLPLVPGEHIQALIDTRDFPSDRYLFFATKQGQVKKTNFAEYDKSRREGFIAINLREGDELIGVIRTSGDDDIFMVSRLGMTIRFNENDVRPMGRDAAGVRGMHLRSGDEVVSVDPARDDASILMVTDAGFGKRTQLQHFNRQGRGGLGVRGIKITAQRGKVVAAFMVGLEDDILVISSAGVMVRMPVREISSQGRDATGVRVATLDRGQVVASVAPVLAEETG